MRIIRTMEQWEKEKAKQQKIDESYQKSYQQACVCPTCGFTSPPITNNVPQWFIGMIKLDRRFRCECPKCRTIWETDTYIRGRR